MSVDIPEIWSQKYKEVLLSESELLKLCSDIDKRTPFQKWKDKMRWKIEKKLQRVYDIWYLVRGKEYYLERHDYEGW